MTRLHERTGGRKWLALYVVLALFTAMAFPLEASFGEYTLAVAGVLGWVTGMGVKEDNARHRAGDDA